MSGQRKVSGVLLSHEKHEMMPSAATRLDLKLTVLRDVMQTERNIYDSASMHNILKITQINLFMKQKQTH